jgi:hypothetical protein
VPKGTLSYWCREIRLSEDQVEAIKVRTYGSRLGVPVDTQWRRRLEIEEIRREARAEVSELVQEPLWVAGVILYWGEGSKRDRKLSIVNSGERLLNLFIRWVTRYLTPEPEFTLAVNLHADNDEPGARRFWAAVLDLDEPRFTKTFIKPDGTGHRKNHLAHGVCRIQMNKSTDAWIRTMTWIDSMGEALHS